MEDLRVQYDALCYATMINIRTLTSGADRIVFRNFDYKNEEHLFIMAVTMACWNVLGSREVAIDGNIFARIALSRRYRNTCKVKKAKKNEQKFVDVPELLEFMRGKACEICGTNFTFGHIYYFYYDRKSGYDV